MDLPVRLVKFWYPESFITFVRVWRNLILVLEEDLAVGLMLKLLFVPLFHDSSIVGKILSFLFRSSRILYGLFASLTVTIFILAMALFWFLLPVVFAASFFLPMRSGLILLSLVLLVVGLARFINQILDQPPKKVWEIKGVEEIWFATKLKLKDATWLNLLKKDEALALLTSLELKAEDFSHVAPTLTDDVLNQVLSLARNTQARFITPAYFWLALFLSVPGVANELLKNNLTAEDLEGALAFLEFKRNKWRKVFVWDDDFAIKHLKGVNRGWLSAPTPNLDSVSEDLTREAARIGFPDFIGQNATVSEVVNILSQDKDRNVLLVGPPGSGRTALVRYLAKLIIAGDAPEALAIKRVVAIDFTKLLSGVTTEGELAQKVQDVFGDVQFVGDIIIFIDELHNLGLGEAGGDFNLYSLLLPYLESNSFQFLATTEPENYARIIEKNGSFARIFHKVTLSPATLSDTTQILKNEAVDLARYKGVAVTFVALKEIVALSSKLIHDRVLPDSALSILTECESTAKDGIVTSDIVKKVFQARINVPVVELDASQKETLLGLEDIIHQGLVDQEEAVKVVSDTLRRSATALREGNRPIGSFLFVGPTGVGKTELAKTLSSVYFKNTAAFMRFDMSEYQTEEAVNRLIGTLENPGELTEAVKNKPYALILLDEFEKANMRVLTLFLQVLDDGRLTDASGKTADFTNTIIIATSNTASLAIAQQLKEGRTLDQIDGTVRYELLKVFKPELVNRFDNIVIFKPLSEPDLEKIAKLKLEALSKQMKEQGYLIEFLPELISALAKKGFDPVLGARPMRRLIQDTIEANLSRMILQNQVKKGEQIIAGDELLGKNLT
ncbi:ATP-dependent Clp protease ATP-binding subunit [Candidatus Daviesbacteria bacterium]|nr:ATP-dependent Clp protease ATP-binding subunit [Candidatus Daviesbacteria bacterium]